MTPANIGPAGFSVPPKTTPTVGNVYATPASTNGVAMNTPGLSILSSISAAVNEACKAIPPDRKVALVAVTSTVNGELRSNLALAAKLGDEFSVTSWIGRSWKKDAGTEWGVQLMLTL